MRRTGLQAATALATLLVFVTGCVQTTRRTVPRGPEPLPDELPDQSAPQAGSKAGQGSRAGHGSKAPTRGSLVTLPDLGDADFVHRSGVTFPEQVGGFRRVRAYRDEDGASSSAEYTDGSGRLRITASVRDSTGLTVAERYEAVREELDAAGLGLLRPLSDDPDATVLTGSTEEPGERAGKRMTIIRISAIGPNFLEYHATYPASRQQAAVEAFEQFVSAHGAAK